MSPGDVVIVDFVGATGIKRRPALVVSADTYQAERPDVILAVITSNVRSATASTDHIIKDWSAAGLKKPSAFRAFLGTYDRRDVGIIVGRLSGTDWAAIKDKLRMVFDV